VSEGQGREAVYKKMSVGREDDSRRVEEIEKRGSTSLVHIFASHFFLSQRS